MTPLLDSFHWRYATKKFDPTKRVSDDDFEELLEVLRLAPSSFGMQPWKFLVIENSELREELRAHAWGQAQVTDASHLIVLCTKTVVNDETIEDLLQFYKAERNLPDDISNIYREKLHEFFADFSNTDKTSWAKHQVYLALGCLLTACAEKQIDSCPMEGFDSAKFNEILELEEEGLTATVLCAVGYRGEGDWNAEFPKARFAPGDVVTTII